MCAAKKKKQLQEQMEPGPRGYLLAETTRTCEPQPNRPRAPLTIGFLPAKIQLHFGSAVLVADSNDALCSL